MTQTKSVMRKISVATACGAMLATAFFAGRLSVNQNGAGAQPLPISQDTGAMESLSMAPLAFDFALPVENVSTDDGQVFNFYMGFTR